MLPKEILEFSVTKNLSEYSDIEVILLKGHLVIEQCLHHFIAGHKVDIKRIDEMNLMYGKLLELAMAIGGEYLNELYPHLKTVNKIRNKLAHQFEYDNLIDDLKSWSSLTLNCTPKTINLKRTYKRQIVRSFAYLAGSILGISNAMQEMKKM